MSTELSQQIARLRGQHVQAAGPIHQGRASLFLSPKEAAAVDVEQVYDAAINGLITLSQYDPRIAKFRDGILHQSSISVQRELKTPEENKALDLEISSLLDYSSIFANETAAHSVIEYLIRRYRVNELNADALIKCLLPIHDTKIFARAVQLCSIEGTIWAFLDGVKASGSPLPRTSIVQRCRKDTAILYAILQVTKSAVSLASDASVRARSAVNAGADRILSFFTAVIVELSETGSLNDSQLRALYPFFMEGLKKISEVAGSETNNSDDSRATLAIIMSGGIINQWRRVCCMAVAQISRKTKLAPPLLKNFVGALVSAFIRISSAASDSFVSPPSRSGVDLAFDACMETLTALAVLAQQQSVVLGAVVLRAAFADAEGSMSEENGGEEESVVSESSSLLKCLEILQQGRGFDASALVKAIAVGLVSALLYPYSESKSNRRPLSFKSSLAAKLICYSIAKGSFSDSVIALVLSKLLDTVPGTSANGSTAADRNDEERVVARRECLRVLRSISQRNPEVFDVCVQAAYRTVSTGEGAGVSGMDESDDEMKGTSGAHSDVHTDARTASLKKLLEDAFAAAPYRVPSESGVSLFLSLENSSANVRTQALTTFATSVPLGCESTADVVGLAYSAMKALVDEDFVVAAAAWNADVVSRVVEHVSTSEFLTTAAAAVAWWSEFYARVPKRGAQMISAILTTLSCPSIAKVLCADDAEMSNVGDDAKVSGRVWAFVTLVHCASGVFSVADESAEESSNGKSEGRGKTPKKSNKKSGHVVESAALSCATAMKEYIPLLAAVKGQKDDCANVAAALAQSVASGLKKDLKKSYANLIEVANYASELLNTSISNDAAHVPVANANKAKALSFARALDLTVSQLAADRGAALQGCVAILSTLLIRFVTLSDARSEKVSNDVVGMLRNLINNSVSATFVSADEASFKKPSASINDALDAMKRPLSSRDVGARVLSALMGSPQAAAAALVGPCLGAFYATNPATVLMRMSVAVTSNTGGAVAADDSNPFVPAGCSSPEVASVVSEAGGSSLSNKAASDTPLLVSALSKAGALCALASLISAMGASAGANGALSETQSAVVVSAVSIAIAACCDGSVVVRKAGVTLGKALASLSKNARVTASFESGDKLAPKKISSAQIATVGELLSSAGNAAAADPLSTPAMLGRKVFGDAEGQTDLAITLLWLASKCGWTLSHLAVPVFTSCSASSLQTTWAYVESLVAMKASSVSIGVSGLSGAESLAAALVQCISRISLSDSATQSAVAAWMCDCVGSFGSKDKTDSDKILGCIREETVRLLSRGWTEGLKDQSVKNDMFSSLIKIQMARPGREEILLALQGISADLSTVASLLRDGLKDFFSAYDKLPGAGVGEEKLSSEDVMEIVEETPGYAVDEEEGQLEGTGMSQPLLRFNSLLEALLPSMVTAVAIADKDADGHEFSAMLASLLDSLRYLNDRRLRAVLSVEYSKTVALDMVEACIPVAAIAAEEPKTKKTPKKGATAAAPPANAYTLSRVPGDVEQVLICLGTSKSTQLQCSALSVLRSLVAFDPDSAAMSVSVLGRLLSSSTMGHHLAHYGENKKGIVGEVLKTLVGVIPASKGMIAQDILEPYCTHFASMPPRRRHVLTYMALNTLGVSSLPACASIILAHTLAAYDPEKESNANAIAAENALSNGNSGGGLILLSRSSQRKAQRALKTSLPEDLFRLASESILSRPGSCQLGTLIAMIKCSYQLMEFASTGDYPAPAANEDDQEDDDDDEEVSGIPGRVSVKIEGVSSMILDTKKLQSYLEYLVGRKNAEKVEPTEVEKKGSAAALLLLQLELVYEILENKTFHRNLVPLADSEDGAQELQTYCLELCEQVLQLLSSGSRAQAAALADAAAGKVRKSSEEEELLTVRLGDTEIQVGINGVGKNVWTWCLDILKSLQKLLDAPAFVAILQELLDHPDAGVRQTALQILGQRLQEMSEGARPGDEERALFTDLASHLREVVREALEPIKRISESKAAEPSSSASGKTPGKKKSKGASDGDRSAAESALEEIDLTSVGIAQSALMCIDVLSRHLGSDPATAQMLTEMLAEVTSHTHTLALATSSATLPSSTATSSGAGSNEGGLSGTALRNFAELVKLLGSSFLCSSTLCGSVGPRAIVVLPKLMADVLGSVEDHGASLIKEESDRAATLAVEDAVGDDGEDSDEEDGVAKRELARRKRLHAYIFGTAFAMRRARLLLLRSAVSAIAVIMTELPSFSHPYIQRSLIAVLKLRDIGDIGSKAKKSNRGSAEDDDDATLLKKARPSLAHRRKNTMLRMTGQDLAAEQAQSAHKADIQLLCGDIDRCLSVLATSIPPRLSVPVLLESAPTLFKASHNMAARFAAVLGDVYDGLDRPTVVQHLSALSSLAILSMDYRRAHGDQGAEANEVDRVVADGVVRLCLKLTETELKNFLARLGEWRDIDTSSMTSVDGGSWRAHSRGASFYMLVSRLAAKLRSIFVPSMGLIWQNAADALTQLVQLVNGSKDSGSGSGAELFSSSSKKSKKRKHEGDSTGVNSSPDTRSALVELTYRAQSILDSVRTCCASDDSDFLNEVRYNTMMPAVVDLLPIRTAFADDNSYVSFVENSVISCLTALARDISKDVLWKPMNHKILLAMRDGRRIVRIAALKTLHKMFIEVGEDYLLLLPECLPFLSELLEDDDSDVAGLTGEVVRYIEELSGEKLDDYLS